ncbi:uncharacterized protein G2W53_028454 [Senna tora]|uniref:Uncharacterized protein n=1 Tax=Senna tora TaxID=362788 RepID=A0A834T4F8_9FABA|nr:uncharacterized protein G2W53_028454 [Senna tora]
MSCPSAAFSAFNVSKLHVVGPIELHSDNVLICYSTECSGIINEEWVEETKGSDGNITNNDCNLKLSFELFDRSFLCGIEWEDIWNVMINECGMLPIYEDDELEAIAFHPTKRLKQLGS